MLLRLLNFVFTFTGIWNTALQFHSIQGAEFCPQKQADTFTEVKLYIFKLKARFAPNSFQLHPCSNWVLSFSICSFHAAAIVLDKFKEGSPVCFE